MTTRSVVVTGLGATTPLGGDVESTWSGMLAGTSGVGALTDDWASERPCGSPPGSWSNPAGCFPSIGFAGWTDANSSP